MDANLSPDAGWAARARAPSRVSSIRPDVDTHVMPAVVCGAGLLIVTLLATYGLDLRVGSYLRNTAFDDRHTRAPSTIGYDRNTIVDG